jgi:phosphoribosylformylglycinamidine synthase
MSIRVCILRAPGTNCDEETAHAFARVGGLPQRVHVNRLLEDPRQLHDYQILCIPGGFSYGDDLGAGRILGNQFKRQLAETLSEFKDAGKLILGICNGFQVLMQSGILLPVDPVQGTLATLTWNDSGRYLARWVPLEVASNKSPFFNGIERMTLPIAHAEGKFVPRDDQAFSQLEAAGQLVLRYRQDDNPTGAVGHVAGACDETGRVCGLMPHPERYIDPCQHPHWTRLNEETRKPACGLRVFENAVGYFC